MKWNWDWKEFAIKSLIRAIRTFAQTFAASITVGSLWTEVQWFPALSVSGVAFVYSLVMSLATGLPEVETLPPNQNDPPDDFLDDKE